MANESWQRGPILVLGGTGKTGRRVADRLNRAGRTVRIGSRQARPSFDWEKPETWGPALDGVSAVYVSYQPDFSVPGAHGIVSEFFKLAVARGVRKLVLLTGRGEPESEEAEDLLIASGADWTILRCSWFAQNFDESIFLEPILSGEVALPDGLAAEPFVDVEDIAEIAVVALTDSRHSGKLYDITGPKALTFAEVIASIGKATGRKIDYLPVPPAAYRAELVRQDVPEVWVNLVMYLFTTVLDGRNTPIADGVHQALGRAPTPFADYVERTAATGVWGGGDV